MSRPESVENEDIIRWSEIIDNDPNISVGLAQSPIIREVMYAGLWLSEQLANINCPDEIITRIQYTAGQLSFGREPWTIHQDLLDRYIKKLLMLEENLN